MSPTQRKHCLTCNAVTLHTLTAGGWVCSVCHGRAPRPKDPNQITCKDGAELPKCYGCGKRKPTVMGYCADCVRIK